jgi:hypothetical protein
MPDFPVEDGVEWKRVADLEEGDEVKGYGVLTFCGPDGPDAVEVSPFPVGLHSEMGGDAIDCWPADAYVPVKVKAKKWRRVITETTDNERTAKWWKDQARIGCNEGGSSVWEYSEVEEL